MKNAKDTPCLKLTGEVTDKQDLVSGLMRTGWNIDDDVMDFSSKSRMSAAAGQQTYKMGW